MAVGLGLYGFRVYPSMAITYTALPLQAFQFVGVRPCSFVAVGFVSLGIKLCTCTVVGL